MPCLELGLALQGNCAWLQEAAQEQLVVSPIPTWADAPDESLRRAAAGVCGLTAHRVHGCEEPEVYRGPGFHDAWIGDWTPDTNRDQLARVFVAALAEIDEVEDQAVVYQNYWIDAITDPRAALCALLDLLQVEVPHE